MMRHNRLIHRFVHYIPERLEPGVLYVSVDYATAVHSCCCGCGQEVVTPLSPTGWKMIFDGETISLSPSIGNWNFECRSHYFIERGHVVEAKPRTRKWSATERGSDNTEALFQSEVKIVQTDQTKAQAAWSRIKRWVANGKRLTKLNRKNAQNGAATEVSKRGPRPRPDQN